MTELDQPVADVCGIESEVFGVETFTSSPIPDGRGDENSTTADAIEKRLILRTVGWIHGRCFGVGLLGESKTPAAITMTAAGVLLLGEVKSKEAQQERGQQDAEQVHVGLHVVHVAGPDLAQPASRPVVEIGTGS